MVATQHQAMAPKQSLGFLQPKLVYRDPLGSLTAAKAWDGN
jgi:hypothetical protein